jgi:hypothetical protein
MDTSNFNLDISWLKELQYNEQNIMYDNEPMSDINISFIYINLNNEIHKIISEKHDLEIDDDSPEPFLSKDYILSVISNKIHFENFHYRMVDILLFNIDLESSELSSLSSTESYINKVSILDDIFIPPSIPIFHSTNSIYVLLNEIPVVKKPSLIISNSIELKPDKIISLNPRTRKQRSLVKYTRKIHK